MSGNMGQVRIRRSLGQAQGCRSKYGREFLFPQYKTLIDNNFGSTKHRAMKFACSIDFRLRRIKWCDHHLCHGTDSDHTQL